MKNLDNIVCKIEKSMDEKEIIREQALKASREIIIVCRKTIQYIHQNLMKEAKNNITTSYDKLQELYALTKNHSDLYYAGFVENAAQELVEASCLYNIINGKELPDPDEIKTTYTSYLMGLCDLVGELRRTALDKIREGKTKEADKYLNIMEEIYNFIIRFDYPSGLIPIKKKQDMIRSLIERTRGDLAVASCERRIEYRTDEFKGILDKLNDKKIKLKNKDNDTELDIDKVW